MLLNALKQAKRKPRKDPLTFKSEPNHLRNTKICYSFYRNSGELVWLPVTLVTTVLAKVLIDVLKAIKTPQNLLQFPVLYQLKKIIWKYFIQNPPENYNLSCPLRILVNQVFAILTPENSCRGLDIIILIYFWLHV